MYRCQGFVVMSENVFFIYDNNYCKSMEDKLKAINLINDDIMLYVDAGNNIYWVKYEKEKNKYYCNTLNFTLRDYQMSSSENNFKKLQIHIYSAEQKGLLAIPFEVFESNWNNNNAQGTEMTISHRLQELDITKEDIKKAREARENELYQQLQKLNKQCLFKMMQELRLLRTTEERKSKKKEIDKLLSDNGFTSGEIDAFWTNTVPKMYSGRNER